MRGAVFSRCGNYRYELSRTWEAGEPHVLFVMLNPSTACESHDDNTIKNCIRIAKHHGYGGLYVGNVYAFKATDPDQLEMAGYPVTEPAPGNPICDNWYFLRGMIDRSKHIVCAWGNNGEDHRMIEMLTFLKTEAMKRPGMRVFHINRLTQKGRPRHPLYVKSSTSELISY